MKKILNLHNSRNRMILLCGVDILTIIIHSYLSLILRYELHYSWIPKEYIHSMKSYLPIGIISTLVIFMILNLYNSVWSFCRIKRIDDDRRCLLLVNSMPRVWNATFSSSCSEKLSCYFTFFCYSALQFLTKIFI